MHFGQAAVPHLSGNDLVHVRVQPGCLDAEEVDVLEVGQGRVAQGSSPGVLPRLPTEGVNHLLDEGATPADVLVIAL